MAIKDRWKLKTQFSNRMKPDEDDFEDIFDSSLNKIDDQIVVDDSNNIGIGHPQGTEFDAKLNIDGALIVYGDCTVKPKPNAHSVTLIIDGSVDVHQDLGFIGPDSTRVNGISTDTAMGQYNASDLKLVTQKAIKDYVDTRIIEGVKFGISNYFVGTIAAFARQFINSDGEAAYPPDGWLVCDGGQYDVADEYRDLNNVIGDQYGAGDGSGANFNVPDLQGIFIRGMDLRSTDNEDPDRNDRDHHKGLKITETAKGNELGGYQADAFKSHNHGYYRRMVAENHNLSFKWKSGVGDDKSSEYLYTGTYWKGSNETRPKNAIYIYCIKY